MEKIKTIAEKYCIYCILFISGIVRLWRIDGRDFWYDEAFTGVAVKEHFWNMMDMIIKDVHPPLYYVTAKMFASFFDYSVFGIRLYSAVFGVLGVWAVYLLANYLFGKKSALWAGAVMAISPFAIHYSQEARMYAMFGFLSVIAILFFFKGLETRKYGHYILWGLFLGLSSLTHYMGIITFPIFLIVFWGWIFFKNRLYAKKCTLSLLKKFLPSKEILLGYGIFAIVFSFWIPVLYRHLFKVGTLVWIKPATLGDVFMNIQIFIFGSPLGEMTGGTTGVPIPNELHGIAGSSVLVALAIFLTAASIYLLHTEEKKEKVISVLVLSVGYLGFIYALSLLGGHYLISRYLTPSAYLLYVFIGLWLTKIRFSYAALFFAVYVGILSLIVPINNSTGWNKLQNDAASLVGKDVYVLNPFDYVIARYYLGAKTIVLYNVDDPAYVAENWAAIGPNARSTKKFDEIRKNNKALILSNTILTDQIDGNKGIRNRKELDTSGLTKSASYANIVLYSFN